MIFSSLKWLVILHKVFGKLAVGKPCKMVYKRILIKDIDKIHIPKSED
jgi:hypothetical protein